VELGPYQELEFDLAGALRDRLIEMFSAMSSAELTRSVVESDIPNAQGVYQIFNGDKLVYIGKTDSEAGLRSRLARHSDKIQNRVGLVPSYVTFKAIRLFVFTVMDLESALLKASRPAWNGGGFGSNDPGRERDTTKIKPTNFDAVFPLDINREIALDWQPGVQLSAKEALQAVQRGVPWKLRRANLGGRSRACHADLDQTVVTISGASTTAWGVLSEIVSQLPTGWQATALKSHVILYKERRDDYPDPLATTRSP
jgi:hypothetical protein